MFTLTDDQRDLASMVREFTADLIAPNAGSWDHDKHFPVDVLRKAAELGMGGIYVREERGGAGLKRLDAALIIEALATGCPSIASYVSIHNMVAWMIYSYGDEVQRARYLPNLCSMEHLGSYCLTDGMSKPAALMAKETVGRAFETTLAEGVHFERRLFHAAFALSGQEEGMTAFVEKRRPVFRHR